MEGYLAQIIMFAGNFAPRNWAYCQGQLLAISANTALFSLLGTTYGGDGRTTFQLPDFRGRTAVGTGQGPGLSNRTLGQNGGSETNIMTTAQMPSHGHPTAVAVSTSTGEEASSNGQYIASHAGAFNEDPTAGANLGGVSSGNTGGNQPQNNMQPFLGMNYVICLQGIFPSRN
jgi:microcystin-dependent protein